MDDMKISKTVRLFLFVVGCVIWAGIWHTGFAVASWILYIPAIFLVVAAVLGICPGLFFASLLTKENK